MGIIEKTLKTLMLNSHGWRAKVTDKLDDDEKYKLFRKVSGQIARIDPQMSEEEIFSALIEKGNLYFYVLTKGTRDYAGIYYRDTGDIFFSEEQRINLESNDSRKYIVAIHESMHKLNRLGISIINALRRSNQIGSEEGAVEYLSCLAANISTSAQLRTEKNKVTVNRAMNGIYKSAHMLLASIMAQLDVILGNNLVARYGLHGDMAIFDEIRKKYGNRLCSVIVSTMEYMNEMRKKDDIDSVIDAYKSLQDVILYECYEKKSENIETAEDAIAFFEELRRLGEARGKVYGRNFYEEYYREKYETILRQLGNDGIDTRTLTTLEYQPPQFFPLYESAEDKEKIITYNLMATPLIRDDMEYENMQRHRFTQGDKIHEVVTYKGIPLTYTYVSDQDEAYVDIPKEQDDGRMSATVPYLGNVRIEAGEQGIRIISEDAKCTDWDFDVTMDKIEFGISESVWNHFCYLARGIRENRNTNRDMLADIKKVPLLNSGKTTLESKVVSTQPSWVLDDTEKYVTKSSAVVRGGTNSSREINQNGGEGPTL